MLIWKELYSAGNQSVDEQHKKLFEMINNFETTIRNKTAAISMPQTMQFLNVYIKLHFEFEEKCMEEVQCSAAEKNKKEHEEFLATYQIMAQRLNIEGYSDALANELLNVAQAWLVEHICGVDVQMKYLYQRKTSSSG